jgi:hypothetical protein
MPVWAWIIVVAVVAALVVLAAMAYYMKNRRSSRLQQRFGPEYERALAERDSRREAEAELVDRERKREQINIVPLSPESQERYAKSWRDVQTEFVDDPSGAVQKADRLVTDVMRERGYPIDDFEQRAADISVDHPDVVQHYRAAHAIYLKGSGDNGAGTEDLRQGFVHYRALFEDLLETRERAGQEARS